MLASSLREILKYYLEDLLNQSAYRETEKKRLQEVNNRGEGNDSSTHLIFSTRITINACREKAAQVFLLIVSILCSLSDFHHVKILLSSLTEFTQ